MPLQEIAMISVPRKKNDSAKNVLLLKPGNIKFPVNFGALERGDATTVPLKPGDIVLCTVGGSNRAVIYDGSIDEPVYAGTSTAVIRAEEMLPEYLCFYLASDIAREALSAMSAGAVIKHLRLSDLKEFPVVAPSMTDEYYRSEYAVLSGAAPRDYRDFSGLRGAAPTAVEDILDAEVASRIDAYYEEQLREFLSSDIEELNTCFSHGAYKATIILAGSILEAVLIDWLSEIKHVNYFEEDYYVYDRRNNRRKRADLIDYINEIKFIERPNWIKEADMAHEIRKKRNLIHAKLCIDSDDVSEETARMVVGYLDSVLKTRGARCLER